MVSWTFLGKPSPCLPPFYYSIPAAAVEAVLGQQFIVIVVDCTGGFAQWLHNFPA